MPRAFVAQIQRPSCHHDSSEGAKPRRGHGPGKGTFSSLEDPVLELLSSPISGL